MFVFIYNRIFLLATFEFDYNFDLFIWWEVCKSLGTFTPVSDNALQMISSKTSSVISAVIGFYSIVLFLLYCKLVTAFCSSCMNLVSIWELNFLHCCNSEWILSFSDRLLSFVLISLKNLDLTSVSSWISSSLLILSYWFQVKTISKFIDNYNSKNILKINLTMAKAQKNAYSTRSIQRISFYWKLKCNKVLRSSILKYSFN